MRSVVRFLARAVVAVVALLVGVTLVAVCVGAYLYHTADLMQPDVGRDIASWSVEREGDSLRRSGQSVMRLGEHGLWEVRLVGDAVERGGAYGAMAGDLLYNQERVFVEQLQQMIPSRRYMRFLHSLILIFNRRMASHVPLEYREEIAAMSQFCTYEYDTFGDSYLRQLNYHAAHDIGHAMQEYMLVGCSSFALWGERQAQGELLVGRNFDFYVGDGFARQKQVVFVEPSSGYRFASVGWPGMMGVLSGMNERGLTVTINAAKGAIPTASAMPISLLARHIVQYASTIAEAYAIAQQARTFVSESLLISSAEDGVAAIIEKTPDSIALFTVDGGQIICTNHFQSEEFADDEYNVENIATSDSRYRHERLQELLGRGQVDVERAVEILRDRRGMGDSDIGLTNEKSINQSIAHHAVVFRPEQRQMWVSTSPWQSGAFVCYDLDEVFARSGEVVSSEQQLLVAADEKFMRSDYPRIVRYRELSAQVREATGSGAEADEAVVEMINANPMFYASYALAGDYYAERGDERRAVEMWREALQREIPRVGEREDIEQKIERYDKR